MKFTFSEEFQEAILGHCLIDQRFFLKCKSKLKGSWFTKNIMIGNLFDQLVKVYTENDRFIQSIEEFKSDIFFIDQSNSDREKYFQLIDACKYQSKAFNLANIEKQLTGFLRLSLFKESVEGAARRYKSEGFSEAYAWTKEHINRIQKATFEDEEFVLSFNNPDEWIANHEIRKGQAISTGNELLDQALGGGLFKKETCAFMAPVNVGKTISMITLARHAIRNGNKVLFIIHEGFPEEIRVRILASVLAVKTETVYKWNNDPVMKNVIRDASRSIEKFLKFVPYIKTGGMFVENVIDKIKELHEAEILATGKGFDLIIDDYPKKLKSRLRSGSKEGLYRVEAAEIYDSFNHLSTELDVHCFVAIQTNRQGLKQNNGSVESSNLLGMEEIDESFGIAQNIANIVSLNRSHSDKKLNILQLNVIKSRNSPTNIAIHTRTDFSCCLSFGDQKLIEAPWPVDVAKGRLVSYTQNTSERFSSDVINENLLKKEEGLSADGLKGVYVPDAKKVE